MIKMCVELRDCLNRKVGYVEVLTCYALHERQYICCNGEVYRYSSDDSDWENEVYLQLPGVFSGTLLKE